MDFNINQLPPEDLSRIFSTLPINDKLTSALVCKTWCSILNTEALLENITMTISKISKADLNIAPAFSRKFRSFLFYKVEINSFHLKFFEIYGDEIKKITFSKCTMKHGLRERCLGQNYCFNLKSLIFNKCFFNIFGTLPCLKELIIKNVKEDLLSDFDIAIWLQTMPNLEKFGTDQPIECEKRVLRRHYLKNMEWCDEPSTEVLSSNAVYEFIKCKSITLTYLYVSAENLEKMPSLLEIQTLRLKQLHVRGDYEIYDFLSEICTLQPNLRELYLVRIKLSDQVTLTICQSLPLLKKLTFNGNTKLNESVKDVFQMKHLRYLNLSDSSNITDKNFRNAIKYFQLHNLTSLNLTSAAPSDDIIRKLLKLLPNLEELIINRSKELSNETVQFISRNLLKLRHLSMAICQGITDEGISPSTPSNSRPSISNLKYLEELNIMGCYRITHRSIEKVVKFERLRKLLYTFPKKNEDYDAFKAKLKSQNPSLKTIYTDTTIVSYLQ